MNVLTIDEARELIDDGYFWRYGGDFIENVTRSVKLKSGKVLRANFNEEMKYIDIIGYYSAGGKYITIEKRT